MKSALRASLSALVLVIAVFAAASTAATQTRIYKDPLGDAEIGHGDIASIAVSDSRGTVILRVDVRGLRDTGVLELKPRTLGRSEYALQFWRSGRWEFTYQNRQGTLTKMSRLPGLRFSRTGNIYSFRFGKTVLKGATRFFFEAHIDTATMADVSDWAPNGDYNTPSGWWKYTVASASR